MDTITLSVRTQCERRTEDLDYSDVLIEKMRERVPELDWRVMDIRELKEHADELGGAGTWDVIIDKGMSTT